jgi:hypothetical protein
VQEGDLRVSKALRADAAPSELESPLAFAGCYEIESVVGSPRPISVMIPVSLALDSTVAVTAGDTSWYVARTLDFPPQDGVELRWRRAVRRGDPGTFVAEIMGRRGASTERRFVWLLRGVDAATATGAAAPTAGASALPFRPEAPYVGRPSRCPPPR